MIDVLLYITFILFSFGQLGRISFFGQQVNIYIYEIPLVLLTFFLLIRSKLEPIKNFYKTFPAVYWFFFWLLLTFLVGVSHFSLFQNSVGILYFLRLLSYFLFFFYLLYEAKKNKKIIVTLTRCVEIFIVLTIFFSLIQYFLYPNLRNLQYLGWDPHLFRLFGLFFDTSLAAAVYGLIFLFLILKWPIALFIFIYFVFILLTYSRMVYLVFSTVFILILLSKKYFKPIGIFILLMIVGLVLIPKPGGAGVNLLRYFSIQSRFSDYQTALQIISRNPLVGYGYDRIRYVKEALGLLAQNEADISHAGAAFSSSYLIILVSSGLIGLTLFLASLVQLGIKNKTWGFFILFIALLSLSDNIVLQPFVLFLLFSFLILTTRFDRSL